jgi:hypothetical protein
MGGSTGAELALRVGSPHQAEVRQNEHPDQQTLDTAEARTAALRVAITTP